MGTLKTYSITSDITGQAVNHDVLKQELKDSGDIVNFNGLCIRGDSIEVVGDSFTEANVDAIILAHETVSLADNIGVRLAEVIAKTKILLAVGFTFDTKQFPADAQSNFNYNLLKVNKTEFTFPKKVGCLNGTTYSLISIDVDAFWTAGKDFVEPILDGNRDLVNSIVTATTQAELDAVVDNR